MATIQRYKKKDGSSTWRVRAKQSGQVRSATFGSRADAREWAANTESEMIAASKQHKEFRLAQKQYLMSDIITMYSRDVLPWKAPNTVKKQEQLLRWWSASIGHIRITDLTPFILTSRREELKIKKKMSNYTVNIYLNTLSAVLSYAVEKEYISINPMSSVKKMEEDRTRVVHLDNDEIQRVLQACKASPSPYLYSAIVLLLGTGCRKREILDLSWRDVDFTNERIYLLQTKNGERRQVHITPPIKKILLELSQRPARKKSPFVFYNPDTGKPVRSIHIAWTQALKRAEVEHIRIHDLRHCFASYMAMHAGAGLHELADLLGHKSIQMTRRYTHLTQKHTRSLLDKMSKAVFQDDV